ncbi:FMN-binding protein [Actinomadura vinacea]|uniref:FMN-binding protein n=1 Tax=Actinomadura vinacea TaxID=115336 RepID=A0ABN3IF47_9ACTN
MRRTTAAVAGTLSGTALLLAVKFGAGYAADTATGQTAGGTGDLGAAPPANQGGRASGGKLKDGVFRGTASVNPHGPIQVTIKVAGGKITGLTATHATNAAMTIRVNKRAIPLLRQETLAAQSAQIDAVSGATYTSGSFKASLQSALAAARA